LSGLVSKYTKRKSHLALAAQPYKNRTENKSKKNHTMKGRKETEDGEALDAAITGTQDFLKL